MREKTFQFRVSTEEREKIRQYADQAGMKDSEYARSAVLHQRSLDSHDEIFEPPQPSERRTEAEENESFKKPAVDDELDGSELTEDEGAVTVVSRPSPEEEFKRRVNRHALRMSRRKAEAIVRKEMGIDG